MIDDRPDERAGEGFTERADGTRDDYAFHEAMGVDDPIPESWLEEHRKKMRAAGMDEEMIMRLYPRGLDDSETDE